MSTASTATGEVATVDVRGTKIRELRGGAGAPLLYLHGAGAENEVWLPMLGGLAENFEVRAPSHPGFLDSEGLDRIRTVEDLAHHYADYLDAVGWQSAAVVGLSLGGWIAAELAARHPDRVSKLVLVSAIGIWIEGAPITDLFAIDARRFPERMREALFADPDSPLALMAFPPLDEHGKPPAMPDELILKLYKNQAAFAKVAWNPLMHDPRLESILHRIGAETLVVWGDRDRVVPPTYGQRWAARIPGARLEVIADCGHLPPLEQPARFLELVAGFLAGR